MLDWPIYIFSTCAFQQKCGQSLYSPPKKPPHSSDYKMSFLVFAESTYNHQVNIDDEVVTMEILDTAGPVSEIILESFVVNILV